MFPYSDKLQKINPSSKYDFAETKEKFVLPADADAEKRIKVKGLTTDELIDACFQGIDLKTYDGDAFSRTFLVTALNSAIDSAEQLFDIAITPRTVEDELHDYEGESLYNYQYTPLYIRPVREVKEMQYWFGNRELLNVPTSWINLDKKMGDVTIVPIGGSVRLITPQIGVAMPLFMMRSYLPMGVKVTYEAGMDKDEIPANLLEWILKRASISIFEVWGDQIIGAGIASSSLSIDGLSQSTGTTQSAMYGGASARILEYRKDLDELTPIIRKHFARFDSVVI